MESLCSKAVQSRKIREPIPTWDVQRLSAERPMLAFPHHTMNKAFLALALLSSAGFCGATDLYRWKDEAGHGHVAESVPERYKHVATRIDSRQFEVSSSDRAEALARSAKERELATAMAADRERAEAAVASTAVREPSITQPGTMPGLTQAERECERLWRRYFESQACFAPYQRREVGPRAEAYSHCESVQAPPSECGPARVLPD
jgi:predicted outer membrane protein